VPGHGKRRAALRRRNRWNRALKKQLATKTTPLIESQTLNNSTERNNLTDCPSTSTNISYNNDNLQNHDSQATLFPPRYSPISSPGNSPSSPCILAPGP